MSAAANRRTISRAALFTQMSMPPPCLTARVNATRADVISS
jgi:hypothetical protein